MPVGLLFAEGGYEPYPVTLVRGDGARDGRCSCWALPRGRARRPGRVLRVGAVVYLLACGLCLAIHTPMGSNIERYAVLLAGPLLLCALAGDGGRARGRGGRRRGGAGLASRSPFMTSGRAHAHAHRGPAVRSTSRSALVGVAVCAIGAWIVWGPVRETAAVAGYEATNASYYAPVERFLARSRRRRSCGSRCR